MTEIEALGSFFYRRHKMRPRGDRHDRGTETNVVDGRKCGRKKRNVPFSRRKHSGFTTKPVYSLARLSVLVSVVFLGDAFYWRVHAIRTSATIIGVLAKDGVYTPVYRYAAPGGQSQLARLDTGSNSVRGKATGRTVSLMISAHNPTEARDANSYLFEILGVVFFVPGIFLGYTALTACPVTLMTWIMAAAMLAYLGERGDTFSYPKASSFLSNSGKN
jgi:hypothetical protein